MNARYCMALDLKDDPALIAEYEQLHARIWPEITTHLRNAGVQDMQIYRLGTRLFMIMDVSADFSVDAFEAAAAANPKVQEWEALMWRYQTPTPWTPQGSKWIPMQNIFALAEQPAPD
ncbi:MULTISPECIES: L-rhamnose mutarotase [Pseudomonas]|jgi:L-rhamnose mutarotase|uniref:L-rhamnose mutarotase n=1 Tax=Pseudomonas lutea TaxID=243924 RepID=A0A9X8QKU5_9PSED|nr:MULTISPECIES: L-rhamnose mutarotase [Pseudomonas]SER04681.1 L-rhamnose mutarotase [Pseudomonas lutea]